MIIEQTYQIASLFNCDITLLHVLHEVKSIKDNIKEYYDPDEDIIKKMRLLSSIYHKKYEIEFNYKILPVSYTHLMTVIKMLLQREIPKIIILYF